MLGSSGPKLPKEQWISWIKREKEELWHGNHPKNSRICSVHFVDGLKMKKTEAKAFYQVPTLDLGEAGLYNMPTPARKPPMNREQTKEPEGKKELSSHMAKEVINQPDSLDMFEEHDYHYHGSLWCATLLMAG